jgi:hypothetical protein
MILACALTIIALILMGLWALGAGAVQRGKLA